MNLRPMKCPFHDCDFWCLYWSDLFEHLLRGHPKQRLSGLVLPESDS